MTAKKFTDADIKEIMVAEFSKSNPKKSEEFKSAFRKMLEYRLIQLADIRPNCGSSMCLISWNMGLARLIPLQIADRNPFEAGSIEHDAWNAGANAGNRKAAESEGLF